MLRRRRRSHSGRRSRCSRPASSPRGTRMADDDRARQEARARELRREIERLKRGSPPTDEGPVDAPAFPAEDAAEDAAADTEAGVAAPAPESTATPSVRDWINKKGAETPFEPDAADDDEAPSDGGSP